jgi:hypothetical protein
MYPVCVDIYNVNLGVMRISKRNRLGNFLVFLAISAPLYFAIEWLWPGHHGKDEVLGMEFKAVFWGFGMSVMFSFHRRGLFGSAEYQLVVDEDEGEISTKNFKSNNRLFSRTVRRGQIRTVVEKEKGLLISSHNRVGTFFWGGIWIPRQLADYEYLKRLVLSWKVAKPS